MKTKFLALIISGTIIVATTVTLLVIYLPRENLPDPSFNWTFPSNSTYHDDYVKVSYMVPMRDGIRLATDVYFPVEINESLPVILVRTPYDKDLMVMFLSSYVLRDYILVLQDTRGFYESEGDKGMPFFSDQIDGHDTLSWITVQPWCNEKIGTWGPSALGVAQYLMAPNAPSSLVCQLPMVATSDSYTASFRGGQLRYELLVPWLEDNSYPVDMFDLLMEHEKLDDYWSEGRIVNNYSDVNTASLHLGGFYDIFCQDTINAFMGYQYQGGVSTTGNAKLIMGPWVHGMATVPTGSMTFPYQNLGIMFKAGDALFEKWLKDNSTLWDQLPTVAFYLMSSLEYNPETKGNGWFQSDKWPLDTTVKELFLYNNLSLLPIASDNPIGQMSYTFEPNSPVPTIGGGNLNIQAGAYDQQSIEDRDDVLVFSTPILTEPITVVGQIDLSLFISSNCTDTDFTVKLTDVYPDNTSMLITDTILRVRNRDCVENWDFITPGSIYNLEIPLDSTAYHFNIGHQLRIDISSSNSPRFEVNPNTGDGLWDNDTTLIANNTIYTNSVNASKLSLPTVNLDALTPFDFDEVQASQQMSHEMYEPKVDVQIIYKLSIFAFVVNLKGIRKIML
ncbi:MAG: CocE/NonD family hydrolase [Candidatus Heimdallarchaeota archaeon]|nr:CocE/NonD family hydrolase [Candidatus Heimdallarchaeota archaeon]